MDENMALNSIKLLNNTFLMRSLSNLTQMSQNDIRLIISQSKLELKVSL